nr:MAG TPA: hypothetical protein [Bacteriophage sp.]
MLQIHRSINKPYFITYYSMTIQYFEFIITNLFYSFHTKFS